MQIRALSSPAKFSAQKKQPSLNQPNFGAGLYVKGLSYRTVAALSDMSTSEPLRKSVELLVPLEKILVNDEVNSGNINNILGGIFNCPKKIAEKTIKSDIPYELAKAHGIINILGNPTKIEFDEIRGCCGLSTNFKVLKQTLQSNLFTLSPGKTRLGQPVLCILDDISDWGNVALAKALMDGIHQNFKRLQKLPQKLGIIDTQDGHLAFNLKSQTDQLDQIFGYKHLKPREYSNTPAITIYGVDKLNFNKVLGFENRYKNSRQFMEHRQAQGNEEFISIELNNSNC